MNPDSTAAARGPFSRAAILAIGTELLTPLRLDTNSLFLTEQLNLLGIAVVFKTVVGDDRAELAHALRTALGRVDLVMCTGGLGPTEDDLTREVTADVLGRSLIEDEAITARIRARFAARGLEMPEINRRQGMVPSGARVIENRNGTAPGLWLEHGDKAVVLLPGPPRELKPMMAGLVDGPLRERAPGMTIVRRVLKVTGRTESHTEDALRAFYPAWASADPPIDITILAALGQIELHLSARTDSPAAAAAAFDAATADVVARLGDDVYSTDGRSLEQVVGDLLSARQMRIAVAESCTGGLLASRLTDVPGSSRYVVQGVVAYANEAKVSLLGVPAELIAAHGAVSEPVAVAMAEGIRASGRVDVGVGVTGIAGPGGGSAEKPVGTVVIAVVGPAVFRSRTFRFIGEREQIKFQASQAALDMVRRLLQ